jgi:hypothetical protein
MLILNGIVKTEYQVRSGGDQRRNVTRFTASYRDECGNEYRKAFESAADTCPDVPRRAKDHAELNAKKYQ